MLGDNADGSVSKLSLCGPPEARKVVIRAGLGVGSDQLEIDAPERFHGLRIEWHILGGTLFLVGDGRTPVHYTVGQDGVNFGAGDGARPGLRRSDRQPVPRRQRRRRRALRPGWRRDRRADDEFLVLASGRNRPDPQPFFTTQGQGATLLGGERERRARRRGRSDTIMGFGGLRLDRPGPEADDVLDGGDGNDFVKGGAGDDQLTGGAGSDHLDGGRGDDRLFALDGEIDTVIGGPGSDLGSVDAIDVVARSRPSRRSPCRRDSSRSTTRTSTRPRACSRPGTPRTDSTSRCCRCSTTRRAAVRAALDQERRPASSRCAAARSSPT